MTTTVVGRVNSAREAEIIIRDLVNNCRCDRSDIALVTLPGADRTRPDESAGGGLVFGALKGAVSGAVIGGILGYFANMTMLTIPGLESVIAAGPLPSAVVGAGIGALIFGVIGSIIGGLAGGGRREEEERYGDPRRSGTVITVHARDVEIVDCAVGVMRRNGAMEIDKRTSDWMKQDVDAPTREPVLRPDPELRFGNPPAGRVTPSASTGAAAPNFNASSYNRPMEESVPVATRVQPRPAEGTPEGWITRKYTATYFGPERRKAANQPYSGAERRHTA